MSGNLTIKMNEVQSVHCMGGVVGVICLKKLGVGFEPTLLKLVGLRLGLVIVGCCGKIGWADFSGLRLDV